ncbi:MAG: DUF333 domain-containing protein [Deltaproteobacteria bacterium]|nr:DUF333 domain-containing protein [Deltaproteobacteria bacterium]MBN2673391.1 DUF333 domain-containing protein [Deltaproteobacteria bacterium]
MLKNEMIANRKPSYCVFAALLSVILMGGIVQAQTTGENTIEIRVGTPNPSAAYCYEMGYDVLMFEDETGEYTNCLFPDGTQCSTWEFLDGMCGDEFSICAELGYAVVPEAGGEYSEYTAYCVDGDTVIGSVLELAGLINIAHEMRPEELAAATTGQSISLSPSGDFNIGMFTQAGNAKKGGVTIPPGVGDVSFSWHHPTDPRQDYMTSVKAQGSCGSCWDFSAVGTVEASYAVLHDNALMELDLSEEYINSECSTAGSCCGGSAEAAFQTIRDDGVPDENCMPYVSDYLTDNSCLCYGTKNPDGTPADCSDACPNHHARDICSFTSCNGIPAVDTDPGLPAALCADEANRRVTIDDYVHVTAAAGSTDIDVAVIQQLLQDIGPLSACYTTHGATDTDGVFTCAETTCWQKELSPKKLDTDVDTDTDTGTDTGERVCVTAGTCVGGVCTTGLVGNGCAVNDDCDDDVNNDGLCDVNDCGTNHCIIITGWSDTKSAWEIKNSWGSNPGNSGYFLLNYHDCLLQRNVWYPLLDPNADLPDEAFVSIAPIQARGSVTLGDRTHVTADLALGNTLTMGFDSVLTGDVTAVQEVDMSKDRVNIWGDAVTGGTIPKGNDSYVHGTEVTGATLVYSAPFVPNTPVVTGDARVVWYDATDILAPGTYDSLTVWDRGTVILDSGDYYFNSITLANDSALITTTPGATVRILVANGVSLGDRVELGATVAGTVWQLITHGNTAMKIGTANTAFNVDVYAPNATIEIVHNAIINGILLGNHLVVGNDVAITAPM